MKHTVWIAILLLAFASGCEGGKSGGSNDGKTASTSEKLSDDDVDKAEDIPVQEDFEEEAAKEITEDNLDDQVAALEKEIKGDAE